MGIKEAGQLLVGAAKVDITPPAAALPSSYKSIHDPVFARAIVIGNGITKAVFIGTDAVGFDDAVYREVSQQIADDIGCPVESILLAGTHSHSAPRVGANVYGGPYSPLDAEHTERAKRGILEAVRRADDAAQPARVGFGTGRFHMNVNRDAVHPEKRTWYQGPNLDGRSDKTVAVVKFESLSGELMAVFINYAMHPNLMYMRNEISGGYSGATSRYLEDVYDDRAVAVWTMGAAGDQNPLYMRLAEPAIAAQKLPAFVAAGGDPQNIPALGRFMDADLDPKTLRLGARLVDSIGQLLGEEVIRVIENTTRTFTEARIWGAQRTHHCPGRRRVDSGREGAPGTYEDADPVGIRIGLLVIGRLALVAVTGEPYNIIGQRLKAAAPYTNTVVVSNANGRSAGYIPDDAAYGRYTFQVLGTRIKQGCAEKAIVNTALDLMDLSLSR